MKEKLNKKLVMTLLARNEEDIIEECIKFHLKQGVDFIIATDNGSIDNTRNIFLKYQQQGVLELIDQPEHNYNQDIWVHEMILIAKNKYHADWIINIDADEFWFCNYGNLKLALPDPKLFNVVHVSAIHVSAITAVPTKDGSDPIFKIPQSLSGTIHASWKCLHTAKGYKKIFKGNHYVKMKRFHRKYTTTLDIIIFHFSTRSYAQFERKIINSAAALKANPRFDEYTGRHIRLSYEVYKQGKLKEQYEQLKIGNINHPDYIKSDSRLYDFINNDYKSIESISFNNHDMYNGKSLQKTFFEKLARKVSKFLAKTS